MIYANVQIDHPVQDLVDVLVWKEVMIDNDKHFYMDYHLLKKMMDSINDNEKDPA